MTTRRSVISAPYLYLFRIGFVYLDFPSGRYPTTLDAAHANEMFKKKNLKKTQALHPLFARGFSKVISIVVSTFLYERLKST